MTRSGNGDGDKSRITSAMMPRVLDGITQRVSSSVKRAIPGGLIDIASQVSKRRRFELLDLRDEDDMARWQVIHNDHARYEVVSEKTTATNTEHGVDYRCLIVYNELGEHLPLTRTAAELREKDADRAERSRGDVDDQC